MVTFAELRNRVRQARAGGLSREERRSVIKRTAGTLEREEHDAADRAAARTEAHLRFVRWLVETGRMGS